MIKAIRDQAERIVRISLAWVNYTTALLPVDGFGKVENSESETKVYGTNKKGAQTSGAPLLPR
jgi:hypothetical protein